MWLTKSSKSVIGGHQDYILIREILRSIYSTHSCHTEPSSSMKKDQDRPIWIVSIAWKLKLYHLLSNDEWNILLETQKTKFQVILHKKAL
jgi:hypothetical protein